MRLSTIPVCFLVLLIITGCDASVSIETTNLSEPAMSERVDPVAMAPINPADTFLPTVGTLHATIKLSNAPSDTTVTVRFYFMEQEKREIAQDAITTNGNGYIGFSLDPPKSGWPEGKYQVEFYLGKKMKEMLTFHIESKSPIIPESTLAPSSKKEQSYRLFNDKQFGMSFELPESWNFKVIGKNNDYLFQGPQGVDEGEIVVVVQMIDTRQPPQSTLDDEMTNQFNMISQRDGAKIVKKSDFQVAGKNAPYFLATYPTQNQQDELVSWGHTQLGLQNGPIILLISYAAPRDIYQSKVDLFQHMMDSFRLSTPNP
ncbi:hypothetical protein UWK_00720 [Desulfocapsa sulfexigens DSM 10523]|uniref:DUF1795 domain-containing protein n=1 Tax=Desulfocapsa sulfexigens (strain DSM 10523 / SB164P1) TaxID=1167006 RepID=M1P197_DESSD|nr:hypothetical protein [Desulfocapsa sulfexigens]AGF77298.1 hypothetical protein UWK_00720 [Desulfocapsa sulfexigens DSM 10523]